MKGCKWGKKNLSFLGNWITEKKDDQDGIWLRIRRGSPLSRHYFGLETEGPDSQQGKGVCRGSLAWPQHSRAFARLGGGGERQVS